VLAVNRASIVQVQGLLDGAFAPVSPTVDGETLAVSEVTAPLA
jgi:hypothetical protein